MTKIPFHEDYRLAMLLCNCHLGGNSCNELFERYTFGRREDAIHVINLEQTLSKFELAARAFCAVPDPSSIIVMSSKNLAKKAIRRFCDATGATPLTGRFTPGAFTNQMIKEKHEPSLIIVADSYADVQTVVEASYINTPCIALTNTDNSLKFVDIGIPINNRSTFSIGCAFFIFAKIIRYMKGIEDLSQPIGDEIEYYFFRNSVELAELANKEESEVEESGKVIQIIGSDVIEKLLQ
jgi:small subunit ribosomal protein SAe